MALKTYRPVTKSLRFMSGLVSPAKSTVKAPRALKSLLKKHSGRSNGVVTVRGQGGRHKRFYREIDFKRDKKGIVGTVASIEYDPNRSCNIALIKYSDGEYRYILSPNTLKIGDEVVSDIKTEVKVGNAMSLKAMPIGTMIHNIELIPGHGGQIARSAGMGIQILSKEGNYANLKLPSGEIRMVLLDSFATVGVLDNEEWRSVVLGKAGRSRHMGMRPKVRGTAMDPDSHPHGGGEGRSGVGRKKPMTFYGKPAVGNTRNKKKLSSKYIVKRRK